MQSGSKRGLMGRYMETLFVNYQPWVVQIRAHMLIIVNRTMDTTSERDPEEVIKKHEDVG